MFKKIFGLFIFEKETNDQKLITITRETGFFSKIKSLFVSDDDQEPPEDYDGWLGV